MRKRWCNLLAALAMLCGLASARIWTDVHGRTTDAELVGLKGATAILKRGARECHVQTNTLCAADVEFLRAWVSPPKPLLIAKQALVRATTNMLLIALSAQEISLARNGFGREKVRNPDISNALMCIAVPADFDPDQPHPLLIVNATSDGTASSVGHLARYWRSGIDCGWVVFAADSAGGKPTNDHDGVRWALISAGLNAMHAAWPNSRTWSCATAGFSGGAKRAPLMAALLLKNGYALKGIYMGGCNADTTHYAMQNYRPPADDYRALRIFISNGNADTISPQASAEGVAASIRQNGFKNVRLELYDGGHVPYTPHIEAALRWFMADH